MELTQQKQLALAEVRQALYDRLKNFSFTEDMLKDKSVFQLLNLLQLLIGHRNYLGTFSHTCIVLEEMFGTDAFWDKPLIEKKETEQAETEPEQKPVVNWHVRSGWDDIERMIALPLPNLPTLEQLLAAVAETRQKYTKKILEARMFVAVSRYRITKEQAAEIKRIEREEGDERGAPPTPWISAGRIRTTWRITNTLRLADADLSFRTVLNLFDNVPFYPR
jgi:hypothetical protein